ncbi:hypothetical protein DPMN_044123 [Dreissena polymorpha]|uniref:Uncharacterized protein n=1 Tax=Dreissena polymorpha TaxID=45954 RepID=A0A9D4HW78_DREPO|nr:hypothetical protein DPMN_044123 [Dreissena polymorpha]
MKEPGKGLASGIIAWLPTPSTAIFTVSLTEGRTAPGVGAFDLADGPADRGGVLLHLARPVRLIVSVSNPNWVSGDFYGLGNRRRRFLRLGLAAIFTVSVTEGHTAPGVGAFDSADGPADRGGVSVTDGLGLAAIFTVRFRVSGDFNGLGHRRPVPLIVVLSRVRRRFLRLAAIFTVSVTEGRTAPGVCGFDSADGPADRGGLSGLGVGAFESADGPADRGGFSRRFLRLGLAAIFTVSVTEGRTTPGVGAFDSANGPADRSVTEGLG